MSEEDGKSSHNMFGSRSKILSKLGLKACERFFANPRIDSSNLFQLHTLTPYYFLLNTPICQKRIASTSNIISAKKIDFIMLKKDGKQRGYCQLKIIQLHSVYLHLTNDSTKINCFWFNMHHQQLQNKCTIDQCRVNQLA